MDAPITFLFGLGNPGRKYEKTRHNIGFMLLDHLAQQANTPFSSHPKWQCHLTKLPNGLTLIKPQTFMNLSGRTVQQILSFHKTPPSQILVAYDDTAIPLGSLRFRQKGSAGGHNGIKSIIQLLGTDEFPRLKIGIGEKTLPDLADYVLGNFFHEEWPIVENTLVSAASAVQFAQLHGIASAANQFNSSRNQL